MSDLRRVFLSDLTRYLEQQQQRGLSVLWCDEALDRMLSPVLPPLGMAESPVTPVAPHSGKDLPHTRQAGSYPPRDQSDSPKQTRQERERLFQVECARFVEEALALIVRTKAAVAGPSFGAGQVSGQDPSPAHESRSGLEPVQQSMFGLEYEATAISFTDVPSATPPSLPEEAKAALQAVAEEIAACTRCALHTGRTRVVPGTGHHRAGLVLIGEAPGQEEDRQGLPFVGRSGQLLTDILRAVDLARQDVFICNILKCRPPDNRDPKQEEADACAPHLARQLAIIQPRLILCLGRVAAQRLLGTGASLGALRRTLHFHQGIPVMATFHPAALLRQPAQKREAWDDIRKVRALYDALSD